MKKVTLTVPWGQHDPTVKKENQNINTVYYSVLFPQIIFHSTVCTQILTNKHDFVSGTFEYTEADTHTAISAFCRQLSILHGRYSGVRLCPSGNKHK